MTKFYAFVIACSLFIVSCKTASKAYQKGDYTDAIELGVKKLQKDPADRETKDMIQDAYNYTVAEREERIRALSTSNDEDRYAKIYREYNFLQDLYQTIHSYPAAARQIRATNFAEYVETYRNKAAEVHITKAEKWMQGSTKADFRQAYTEYRQALAFRPNDAELRMKTDSAYDAAVTKVLIVPLQNQLGYSYASSYQLQNFQNAILQTLSNNMRNDFVRFYSEWASRSRDFQPDQILELNLGRITIGQPYDNRNTREASKEVVVKEIVYKPDSVVKQYGTVRAKITTTQRTLLSEGDLYITLRDTQGRTIWNDRFTGQHRWQTEFASYTGDERALSDTDKQLLNRNNNYEVPREDQIMGELFRQIQSDLFNRLHSYYSRY